jgi:WD40 repeat protein
VLPARVSRSAGTDRIAVSADRSRLLSLREGKAMLWNASRLRLAGGAARIPEQSAGRAAGRAARLFAAEPYACVALSPDGRTLALGSAAGGLSLQGLGRGERQVRLGSHPGLCDCCFSPEGTGVLGLTRDGALRLWDRAQGRELPGPASGAEPVREAVYSPDGALLAGMTDQALRIWTATTLELRCEYLLEDVPETVSWSPEGKRLAIGTGQGLVILLELG